LNKKYCFLQLGNQHNGRTSSCATDAGIAISSVGPTTIELVDLTANTITQLASFKGDSTSLSKPLDMTTNIITDLSTPTANRDAATKGYVDSQDALKLS